MAAWLPSPGGAGRRAFLVAALVLPACLAAWATFTPGSRTPRPGVHLATDPAATLGADSALARAVRLDAQGRHRESLPYFRRAAQVGSGWLVHWDYAAALNNAATEVEYRAGSATPTSRSSVERVALVRAALEQVALAEAQAPTTHTRALLGVVRGRTLQLWGFPLDGLVEYRAALALEPGLASAREEESALLHTLRAAN